MKQFFEGKRWLKGLLEVVVVLGIVMLVSTYLTRNMLPKATEVSELNLPSLQQYEQAQVQPLAASHIRWGDAEKTLVYFFATWCSVCRISMPGLSLLADKEGVQIVTVALDWQQVEEVREFVDDVGYEGTVLMGGEAARDAFKVDAYPSYYVVDSQGKVLHKDRGLTTPPGLWLRLN